ncbi:uncharacterized protein (DUF2249 family) [Hydrogenivirga caldilitoris]|uniref:Uncharacterized protein (DUF2249 family) n=1 Tax=Hydrogenivirga caldilitoris TaxID=246264 RepID=A0A497XNG6_9AQUI|nr:DUF2249 domain-containing protein [Hydrogenivirga caldilitoris]RLJ70408.1 uncharacterized protein (DUF2249 family) [Hydrogenivirga caldilitoris]
MVDIVQEIKAGKLEVRKLKGKIYPSATGSERVFVLLSGRGKLIKGQSFRDIEGEALISVEPGEIFGFIPEGSATLLEISTKTEKEKPLERIELREMEPARRHPLVMEKFKELKEGEAFEIVNDHDPLPLYFQMNMFFPGKVGWEYVEGNGDRWIIRIEKLGGGR